MSKIMPVIMLGFVNYAHFSKKFRIDASDLYFFKVYKKSLNNYMQQKGKWQNTFILKAPLEVQN